MVCPPPASFDLVHQFHFFVIVTVLELRAVLLTGYNTSNTNPIADNDPLESRFAIS